MQVTIDTNDSLERVLDVVGSMFGVRLVVSTSEPADASAASVPSPAGAATARRTRVASRRRPASGRGGRTAGRGGRAAATGGPAAAQAGAAVVEGGPDPVQGESVAAPAESAAAPAKRGRRTTKVASGPEMAAVRAWALANGHPVKDRGPVPAAVMSAYLAQAG